MRYSKDFDRIWLYAETGEPLGWVEPQGDCFITDKERQVMTAKELEMALWLVNNFDIIWQSL